MPRNPGIASGTVQEDTQAEIFKVDLSDKLYALKQELLTKNG
jgi:hypothetical protein